MRITKFQEPIKDLKEGHTRDYQRLMHVSNTAVMSVLNGLHSNPTEAKQLLQELASKNTTYDVSSIMQSPLVINLVKSYNDAANDKERRMIASSFVCQFTFKQCLELPLSPPLTQWAFRNARCHLAVWGAGRAAVDIPITRIRISLEVIEQALAFIYDPQNLQQVAFGEKTMRIDATGEEFKIPKALRTKLQEQLWLEYRSANTLSDGRYAGLERSAFLKLCKDATGGRQKALGALDNISVRCGTENWSKVEIIINELAILLAMSPDAKENLLAIFKSVKDHIKYDLQSHLRNQSQCSRHCYYHMLSDPDDRSQQSSCEAAGPMGCGTHDAHCSACDSAEVFFASLRALQAQAKASKKLSADDSVDMEWRINQCIQLYGQYLRHEIRGHYEKGVRPDLVSKLEKHQVILVWDWKMKFLM